MANCGNCKAKLGCSCKVRKAVDGKSCCVSCINVYNKKINFINKNKEVTTDTTPTSVTAKAVQKN